MIEPAPGTCPPEAAKVIAIARNMTVRMVEKILLELHERQEAVAEPVDVLIGAIFGLHDLAARMTGHPIGAVEWLRNVADVIERGELQGVTDGRVQ